VGGEAERTGAFSCGTILLEAGGSSGWVCVFVLFIGKMHEDDMLEYVTGIKCMRFLSQSPRGLTSIHDLANFILGPKSDGGSYSVNGPCQGDRMASQAKVGQCF